MRNIQVFILCLLTNFIIFGQHTAGYQHSAGFVQVGSTTTNLTNCVDQTTISVANPSSPTIAEIKSYITAQSMTAGTILNYYCKYAQMPTQIQGSVSPNNFINASLTLTSLRINNGVNLVSIPINMTDEFESVILGMTSNITDMLINNKPSGNNYTADLINFNDASYNGNIFLANFTGPDMLIEIVVTGDGDLSGTVGDAPEDTETTTITAASSFLSALGSCSKPLTTFIVNLDNSISEIKFEDDPSKWQQVSGKPDWLEPKQVSKRIALLESGAQISTNTNPLFIRNNTGLGIMAITGGGSYLSHTGNTANGTLLLESNVLQPNGNQNALLSFGNNVLDKTLRISPLGQLYFSIPTAGTYAFGPHLLQVDRSTLRLQKTTLNFAAGYNQRSLNNSLDARVNFSVNGAINITPQTVANLDAWSNDLTSNGAGKAGTLSVVNDALNPAYRAVVVGGGNQTVLVMWNGAAWICH